MSERLTIRPVEVRYLDEDKAETHQGIYSHWGDDEWLDLEEPGVKVPNDPEGLVRYLVQIGVSTGLKDAVRNALLDQGEDSGFQSAGLSWIGREEFLRIAREPGVTLAEWAQGIVDALEEGE
jgi:hypothetical protein